MSPPVLPPRAPRLRAAAWALVAAYLGLIFYLSSLSNPFPELARRIWDKAAHGGEYAALGALLALALWAGRARPRTALWVAALAASAWGASDELHQAFVPGRQCDIRDWVADTLGAALGALAAAVALRGAGARASIEGPPRASSWRSSVPSAARPPSSIRRRS